MYIDTSFFESSVCNGLSRRRGVEQCENCVRFEMSSSDSILCEKLICRSIRLFSFGKAN